jgi:hypothetical protein
MPKKDMTQPTTRTSTAPRVNPKIRAAMAATVPNTMITLRRPHRSTSQASASLPGMDTSTMTAVKANADVSVKPMEATTVGMNVWIE